MNAYPVTPLTSGGATGTYAMSEGHVDENKIGVGRESLLMRYALSSTILVLLLLTAGFSQPQPLIRVARVLPTGGSQYAQHMDCLEVLTDGSYTILSQLFDWPPGGIVKHQQYSSKLNMADMEQLSLLLADPGLASIKTELKKGDWIGAPSMGQSDALIVLIKRASGKQSLFFNSSTGEGRNYSPHVLSVYNTPEIKPLLGWYKQITKRKGNPDPSVTLDCSKPWDVK